jgi:hypothetical protein
MGVKLDLFLLREEHRLEVGFEVPTAVTQEYSILGFNVV